MQKEPLEKWITLFSGQTFSSHEDSINWIRKTLPALVEDMYQVELTISDDRWKRAEARVRELEGYDY